MLIAMAVHDTIQNQRSKLTGRTLYSLSQTVHWNKHRLIISDNGSCQETLNIYAGFENTLPFTVILNGENLGTANAINRAWHRRAAGEHCVKIDNDIIIHQPKWAEWMQDVFQRDPSIGICALKLGVMASAPCKVRLLPHSPGQRWLAVETAAHVLGAIGAYSSALLDKIGYMYQPGLYGFDDLITCIRAKIAGFESVYLHAFDIEHIDPGGTDYTAWKKKEAQRINPAVGRLLNEYRAGKKPIYYDGGF